MNKERMLQLADHIEKQPPEKFYMGAYVACWLPEEGVFSDEPNDMIPKEMLNPSCNTAGCIAGHAAALFDPKPRTNKRLSRVISDARYYLDLSDDEQHWLFMGEWSTEGLENNNPKDAAKAIRYLVNNPQVAEGSAPDKASPWTVETGERDIP